MKHFTVFIIVTFLKLSASFSQTTKLINHTDLKFKKNISTYRAKVYNGSIYILIIFEPNENSISKAKLLKKSSKSIKKINEFEYNESTINDFIVINDTLFILNSKGLYRLNGKNLFNIKSNSPIFYDLLGYKDKYIIYNAYDFIGKDSIKSTQFKVFNINDTICYFDKIINIPGIELSRLVNKWVDYNDTIFAVMSPISDTIKIFNTYLNQLEPIILISSNIYPNGQYISTLRRQYGNETKKFIRHILTYDTLVRNEKIFLNGNTIIQTYINKGFAKIYRGVNIYQINLKGNWELKQNGIYKCVLDSSDVISYETLRFNFSYSESQFFYNEKLYTLSFAFIPPKKSILYFKYLERENKIRNKEKVSLKLLEYEFNF